MLVFFLAGLIFCGGFNWRMEMTNTESFCISCHEMEQNVYQEYKTTIHYSNSTGVRATCPECHVPRDWVNKMVRKVGATNEIYHWIVGSIDTAEKFESKRHELAQHVWKEMRESDSRECRNCHDYDHMSLQNQTLIAKKSHELGVSLGESCIDCHQGIAHTLPVEFDREAEIDELHHNVEQQGVACYECHEDLHSPADDEEW